MPVCHTQKQKVPRKCVLNYTTSIPDDSKTFKNSATFHVVLHLLFHTAFTFAIQHWQNGGFRKVMFSSLHNINFFGFFRNPGIIEAVPLGTFRRIWISGVHAINFFELSRNPLDLRSRDIM